MLMDPATGRAVVQPRGIIYLASLIPACVAEYFQRSRVINRIRHEPWLVGFETSAPLDLLDLTGLWPTAAGASMNINSGSRHIARAWSRSIYDAYPWAHGLWYGSSMYMNTPSVALYGRGRHATPTRYRVHIALADDLLLADLYRVSEDIQYRLL